MALLKVKITHYLVRVDFVKRTCVWQVYYAIVLRGKM
jgi:hypothetical protein